MLEAIPTFVICVPGLPERTEYVTRHLAERGVSHRVWQGFPGVSMGLATNLAYYTDAHTDNFCDAPGSVDGKCGGQLSYHLKAGTVAVTMSHLALMKHIVAAEYPVALVLENDVELPADFREKFEQFYTNLPNDFGLAYLDHLNGDSANAKPVAPGVCIIPGGAHGTDAYLVSAKGAKFIDDHCQQAWRPIDVSYMVEAAGYGKSTANLPCYYADPPICTQLTAHGRLDGSLHFDRSRFAAPAKPVEEYELIVIDSTTWGYVKRKA